MELPIILATSAFAFDWLHDISWVPGIRNEFLTPIFEVFTWLGYHYFYMFFMPVLYWLWDKKVMLRTAVIVAVSGLLNSYLKDLWQNPRPDIIYSLDPDVGKSLGMPSGHTQISAVLWFWLATEIKKNWMWALAAFVVTGIAFSRIYLGVHDPEDVIVGFALAVATIIAAVYFIKHAIPAISKLPALVVLGAVFAVQMLIFWQWPTDHGPGPIAAIGAFLLAWLIAVYFDRSYMHYIPPAGLLKKALALVAGVVGLIVVSKATSKLFDALQFEGLIAIYTSASIMGLYMAVFAPLMLQKLKLATRGQQG